MDNLEEIIKESDSIMVARGDLGVELEAWDVPAWQKKACILANKNSTPVIVATQMLESMVENARECTARLITGILCETIFVLTNTFVSRPHACRGV